MRRKRRWWELNPAVKEYRLRLLRKYEMAGRPFWMIKLPSNFTCFHFHKNVPMNERLHFSMVIALARPKGALEYIMLEIDRLILRRAKRISFFFLTQEVKFSTDISIVGTSKQIERAKKVLKKVSLDGLSEAQARLAIQDVIDEHNLNASIAYRGRRIWNRRKILWNLNRIIERGNLYGDKPVKWVIRNNTYCTAVTPPGFKPVLSKYFYEFLTMCCGCRVNYTRAGWIGAYPTLEDLKRFFMKNEYGVPVSKWIPWWQADVKRIVEDIEIRLSPLRSYMRHRSSSTNY